MHGSATEWKKDNSSPLKELLGKWFFLLYSVIYGGFILLNVFSPDLLGIDVGSINVAIVYGLGLIIFAMFLAFAYNHVSSSAENLMNTDRDEEKKI